MKVIIIAEAGVNHNGSLAIAKKLVDVAKLAKADYVKFQTFNASALVIKNAIKKNPLGRAADPRDIAEVVLFLASEKNRFINGETVIVNGGATMV